MADSRFPLGAAATLEELDRDPHPLLARLREREPVSWLPALDGWLITRYDLAIAVMTDARGFTVDDPRFSTAQVVGPSMLSLDGDEHARHRAPFVGPFRATEVSQRFARAARQEAERLVDTLLPIGSGELRRSFAGPLAAAIVTRALGLDHSQVDSVLRSYDAIVSSVTQITAGGGATEAGTQAFDDLAARLKAVIDGADRRSLLAAAAADTALTDAQIVSNAAVLLFGGIETTEGMIANAILHVLGHPDQLAMVRRDSTLPAAVIDESLRLEPAAAVIDRYATAPVGLGGAQIASGELVRISISAANRDPAVFAEPDRFDPGRANSRRHLAFAHGPHVCVGVHLARLEARTALESLVTRMPRLRLDPERPSEVRGLVFRKPVTLNAVWT